MKKIVYFLHIMPQLRKLIKSNLLSGKSIDTTTQEIQTTSDLLAKETSEDERDRLNRTLTRLTAELNVLKGKAKRILAEITTLITEIKLATTTPVTTLGGRKKTRHKHKLNHLKKKSKKNNKSMV